MADLTRLYTFFDDYSKEELLLMKEGAENGFCMALNKDGTIRSTDYTESRKIWFKFLKLFDEILCSRSDETGQPDAIEFIDNHLIPNGYEYTSESIFLFFLNPRLKILSET